MLPVLVGLSAALTAPAVPRAMCIGECLFDSLPGGLHLGGAPLNVAVHLRALGADVTYASAVGSDRLGAEALRRLERKGLDTRLVKVVPNFETGFVTADLDEEGDATYTFVTPSAWDEIPEAGIAQEAAETDVLIIGTLGQRSDTSRRTIQMAIMAAVENGATIAYDVNLRDDDTPLSIVRETCLLTPLDILKLNDEEILPVAEALGCEDEVARVLSNMDRTGPDRSSVMSDAAAVIGEASNARCVVVTRGESGAVSWERSGTAVLNCKCPGYEIPEDYPIEYSSEDTESGAPTDTIGAGDAFLAQYLMELLDGGSGAQALDSACRLGCYVANARGATPALDEVKINLLQPRGASALLDEERAAAFDGDDPAAFAGSTPYRQGRAPRQFYGPQRPNFYGPQRYFSDGGPMERGEGGRRRGSGMRFDRGMVGRREASGYNSARASTSWPYGDLPPPRFEGQMRSDEPPRAGTREEEHWTQVSLRRCLRL